MIKKLLRHSFLPVLVFASAVSVAQTGRKAASVFIHGTAQIVPPNAAAWTDSFYSSSTRRPAEVVLSFSSLPTESDKLSLQRCGIQLNDYLPTNFYTATIAHSRPATALPVVLTGIIPLQPSWKIESSLLRSGTQATTLRVNVLFSAEARAEDKIRLLAAAGAIPTDTKWSAFGVLEAEISATKLLALAASPLIKAIDRPGKDQPLNWESQGATKTSIVHAPATVGGWNLKGEGMTIGIGDQSSGWNHADLRDRIKNFVVTGYANHGMHINGIVGGAGNIEIRNEGFAPRARLLDHYFSNILAYTPSMRSDFGMSVTNNSYGNEFPADCAAHGSYNTTSVATDNLILQFPDVTHVFAGGNSGLFTCSPYPAGFGTIYGSYQSAKNSIVVANMDKEFVGAADNARGPVRDGRLKPDITAVGSGVSSTRGTDQYLTAGGTSMASPQVAGGAALLQQRYKQLHGNTVPNSLLLKSLLLNGAMDIGNPGPDFTYGYGAMNLRRSMLMLEGGKYIDSSVGQGLEKTFTINVPPGTATLKVMLSWNDVAASPLAAVQLVNDLDLTVTQPNSVVRRPLVPDHTPGNVNNTATENEDHLNNNEQVVVEAPAAGMYSIKVKGTTLPSGVRPFVVSYDLVRDSIRILHPFGGYAISNNLPQRIYWDASPGTDTFRLEYSTDNGSSWNSIPGTVAASDRHKLWTPPVVNVPACRLRLTRGAQIFVSDPFPVSNDVAVSLQAAQCPGYIAIKWPTVPNATGYEVLRKKGAFMQVEATTADTSYFFAGLSQDSTYYVSVQPLFGSVRGLRAYALIRRPNDGNCAGAYSDNDLAIDAILNPQTGRQSTSTALTAATSLTVRLRNNDNVPQSSYRVSYNLDGLGWTQQTFAAGISGNSAGTVSFTGLNMASPGVHTLVVAVQNLSASDPVSANDTVSMNIRQLVNAAVSLSTGFSDDFEALPELTIQRDTSGFTANEHWDYFNSSDSARLRSFVTSPVTIGGARSISLDAEQNLPKTTNHLTGTFNLATVNVALTEIRCEADYKLHGIPNSMDSNGIWVRGSDSQAWVKLFTFDSTLSPGVIGNTGSLSVTDALNSASQTLGSSMQVRFSQRDTSLIGANDYGNGLTLDNFRLYSVTDDVSLLRIVSPAGASCGMGSSAPISVKIGNGMSTAQTGVQVTYQLNNGTPVTETVPSIPAKDSITYTFTAPLSPVVAGLNTVRVWVTGVMDSYADNDSITNYTFRNQPVIAAYPYLQDFENNDGFFYTEGFKSSWEYGTPSSGFIHAAASGTKAWKTSLTGSYNDNEHSYLYGPCFDISSLSNPMLSFSAAFDIEDCGATLCDGSWVEYSTNNGGSWTKLGAQGQGTNWYNSATDQLWSQDSKSWRVASIPLPVSVQPLRFRFVFDSDPGTTREGLAIDDIHIYDRDTSIYNGGSTGPVTATPSLNSYTPFLSGGNFLAEINPGGSTLGSTSVSMYAHTNFINVLSQQYFLPRSFLINSAGAPADSVTVRLFVLESEVQSLIGATGCPTCSKPDNVYELGVTQYDGANENGTLSDNSAAGYVYHPYSKVRWVPYDNGYYAQFRVAGFSEFWFNDGGPTNSFPLPIAYINFTAEKISETTAKLEWVSRVDTYVTRYEVQQSFDALDFKTISRVIPQNTAVQNYTVYDTPVISGATDVYYRLRYFDPEGREGFSPIRKIAWTRANSITSVFPNPVDGGRRFTIQWSGSPGESLGILLTDLSGRVVYKANASAGGWNNLTEVSVPAAAPGVYFLKATIGSTEDNRKLIFR